MFNFACWNINGFSQEKFENDTFYKKFDIFGLTETWTSKDKNINLPGYRAFTSYASKGNRKPEDQWSCKRSPEISCIYQ